MQQGISIHAPIVGCDDYRRAVMKRTDNFNPRTHRGVRLSKMASHIELTLISIHAPIVGCDHCQTVQKIILILFQSTHPSWGATPPFGWLTPTSLISIHAPIVGCDSAELLYIVCYTIFQSTHPSWGATIFLCMSILFLKFQSTHPSWGATEDDEDEWDIEDISIHAPIVGCDKRRGRNDKRAIYFNPRTHRGVRL